MPSKLKYLSTCIKKTVMRQGFACPSCNCPKSSLVSRKHVVTALRRCSECELLFRTPTTTSSENSRFYQQEYAQGFTTDCPNDATLAHLTSTGFQNSEKDFSRYLEVVRAAGGKPGDRLFDFGCSWGYGSWQFQRANYDVESFEISVPRATYARTKLGIDAHTSLDDVTGPFDIFFSAHVLEHVPSVSEAINFAMTVLKPGGLFVAFTPNGSAEFRKNDSVAWDHLWGLVHPNFLDDQFYRRTFSGKHILISSGTPSIDAIESWAQSVEIEQRVSNLGEYELMLLARKPA